MVSTTIELIENVSYKDKFKKNLNLFKFESQLKEKRI